MLRIIITVCNIFFFISSGVISAQTNIDSTDSDQLIIRDNYQPDSEIDVPSKNTLNNKKLHTGLEAGTSFSYSPGNFFGPSFYITPNLSYRVNPRFMLQSGVGIERSNYQTLYETNGSNSGVLPMTRAFFYARGSYLLTPRITLDGTVFKTINDVPKLTKYSSPVNYSQNGAIIGINYKLNNSLSFGFHVQMYNNSFQQQNSDTFNPFFGY